MGMLTLAFDIQPVEASGSIYIRADGSIVPPTANITTVDNATYTFTGNIFNNSIVVERDNIVVDGTGYTLDGAGVILSKGIELSFRSNVTIKNMKVKAFGIGVYLFMSSNNSITENNVTANDYGIYLDVSSNNTISGNNIIAHTRFGIHIYEGFDNNVYRNTITNNNYGISLCVCTLNNKIYHNNFVDNTRQVRSFDNPNVWDDGYPKGGNYWSDYTGVDLDHDGISDSERVIDAGNIDKFPLMGMFSGFNTSLGYHVNVISNSTIENFQHFESNSTIKMYVSNMTATQTYGFCRVCIPRVLMNVSNISVIIDDGLTAVLYYNYTLYDNGTHRWIYFAYPHSIHEIDIIPEFPSFIIMPLFMVATLLAVIVYRLRNH